MIEPLRRLAGVSKSPVADTMLAVATCLFAGVVWWQATKIPPPFFDPLGSAAVPNAIALILLVLALIMLLRAALAWPWLATGETAEYRPRPDLAVGIVVLCVAYVAAMHLRLVGFENATIAFLVAAAALLGRLERRTMVLGVGVALLMGFGTTWLLTRFFYIDLPR